MAPRLSCASASPCSAALPYFAAACDAFLGTPSPLAYITPRSNCALACPCSAALRYHAAACDAFLGTPSPLAYMTPRLNCALATPCSAALRNRSEEHTSELQSRPHLVCRLLLEKKNK